MLALLVGAIAMAVATVTPVPSGQNRTLMALLPTIISVLVLWKMAAGVGLYWGVSSVIGGVQTLVAARTPRSS